MKRWHLTFGLTTLAIGAAFLAPRLTGLPFGTPTLPPEPPPEPLEAPPPLPELPPAPSEHAGNLVVDAGFDRWAAPAGASSERWLTVTVTAPEDLGVATRRSVDLSVVMDTSGSMSARGKMDQARRAAKGLAARLVEGDAYALTVFNDDAVVAVPRTTAVNAGRVGLAIDRIYEGGGTNLYAGLERGASELRSGRGEGQASRRIVLLSDGKANVGVTDDETLVRFAADLASEGATLSTVGLGLDYNEDLLARLADVGGGTYHFVDDASALDRVFTDELDRVTSVVATGTELRLQLPAGIHPVEVVGWDAVASSDGWSVFLGDVAAGQTKTIVAKVRVDGHAVGDSLVGAAAHYLDLADERSSVSRDEARLVVTSDLQTVRSSLDRARAVEANRAAGAKALDMATRAWADGDVRGSAQALDDFASSPPVAGVVDIEVQEALGAARRQLEASSPSSEDGLRAIKRNKELSRDLAR